MSRLKLLVYVLLLGIVLLAVGCGGNPSGSGGGGGGPVPIPDIAFLSSGALDGSNAPVGICTPTLGPNALLVSHNAFNVWGANTDGSLHPITKLATCDISFAGGPAFSPDGSKIAFASNRALNGQDGTNPAENIWVMNTDGTGLKSSTSTAVFAGNPVWSPDGSTIAFSLQDPLSTAINVFSIRSDGSGLTQLTNLPSSGRAFTAGWSPDGRRLAFISNGDLGTGNPPNTSFDTNLWVMNADGTGQVPLTKYTYAPFVAPGASSAVFSPAAFSKDGTKILFASDAALDGSNTRNFARNLWVINPDGTNAAALTQFTSSPQGVFAQAWSPDGKKIAYITPPITANDAEAVFVINADGTNPTQITHFTRAGATESDLSWSSDSTRLVFSSDNAAGTTINRNIWLVNADGSGLVSLTKFMDGFTSANGIGEAVVPVWRP